MRTSPNSLSKTLGSALLAVALCGSASALAQDTPAEGPPGTEIETASPPPLSTKAKYKLNGTYKILDMVEWFAKLLGHTYILEGAGKDLSGEVRFIGHEDVSAAESEQAFLLALETAGYSISQVGKTRTIVKSGEASQHPIRIYRGEEIPYTASFVTQIMPLQNVSVSDISTVVSSLASPEAKIIAYAPTNTMIITDSGHNLRKVFDIITELDVAAPRSRMEIIPIEFADAAEIAQVIEELYGTAESGTATDTRAAATTRRTTARDRRRAARDESAAATSGDAGGVTAGKESNYISKVLSDERTNSLIVLANDQGFTAIYELLEELDVDVDLSSRSQIHVIYLQHAKAEEVAGVLANLADRTTSTARTPARRTPAATPTRGGATATRGAAAVADSEEGGGGVAAAFDSGMRITHDENTNALVIIAAPEDFKVVKSVVDKLDIRRRQVFVDAVILELSSDESVEFGMGVHGPFQPGGEAVGFLGLQSGQSSLGLTQDLLSGLAIGVFGESITVPFSTAAGITDVDVPAFGIVVNALKGNSLVNIVSNPNLLTLDNEEAQIVIGRKIPFPTSSGLNSLGQPVVSYQREDVATTLKITPRVNSENFVTLEVTLEVSEIEEDDRGLDVNQAGFITSKREIETVALVADNETVVLGGLVGMTDTEVETKVPVLGDLPILGALFRGSRIQGRKSNLMVFLTPHIIDDEEDMREVMRVKEAQRQEFIRRFYGKSRDESLEEIYEILKGSRNYQDQPSQYRGSESLDFVDLDGEPMSDETREALEEALREDGGEPGAGAGDTLDEVPRLRVIDDETLPEEGDDTPMPVPAEETPVEEGN